MKGGHLELKKIKNQGNSSSRERPTAVGQAWKKKNGKRKNYEPGTPLNHGHGTDYGLNHGRVLSCGQTTAPDHVVVPAMDILISNNTNLHKAVCHPVVILSL